MEATSKLYVVLDADWASGGPDFYPVAAFTRKRNAWNYKAVSKSFCLIDELDCESISDRAWIVMKEVIFEPDSWLSDALFIAGGACPSEDKAKEYAATLDCDYRIYDVPVDKEIDKLNKEFAEYLERNCYKSKFSVGDKVRMLTLDEILSMDGVERQRDVSGTDRIINNKFHVPVWICIGDKLAEMMGRSFTVEKTLGDCVFTPNGYFLQEWLFVKDGNNNN